MLDEFLAGASVGDVGYYVNTGTFLRTVDGWKVIAWQATRMAAAADVSE